MAIKHEVCWSTARVDEAVFVTFSPMFTDSSTGASTAELFSL